MFLEVPCLEDLLWILPRGIPTSDRTSYVSHLVEVDSSSKCASVLDLDELRLLVSLSICIILLLDDLCIVSMKLFQTDNNLRALESFGSVATHGA